MGDGRIFIDSYLAPLADFLSAEDITDIYINRPGQVFTESLLGIVEEHEVPELTSTALIRLARQVASLNAQGINRQHPLLAGVLPGGSRIQIVLPPATRGEVAISIRRHLTTDLRLEDYANAVGDCADPGSLATSSIEHNHLVDSSATLATLRSAVLDRKTILISGGTSSGKTTFLNALIQEIPRSERLILIEDTPELHLHHRNAVGLLAARGSLGEAEITAEDLLTASLRMRPDRIILGELRGSEALTYLRAVNTGHPGSLSTIHADSPERAIDQLALLLLQSGANMSWDTVAAYLHRSIDLIVQLERRDGRRVIQGLLPMKTLTHKPLG